MSVVFSQPPFRGYPSSKSSNLFPVSCCYSFFNVLARVGDLWSYCPLWGLIALSVPPTLALVICLFAFAFVSALFWCLSTHQSYHKTKILSRIWSKLRHFGRKNGHFAAFFQGVYTASAPLEPWRGRGETVAHSSLSHQAPGAV